jgi:hypothetical protein
MLSSYDDLWTVSRAEGAVPVKESIDRLVAHSLKTRCRTTVCSLMYDTGGRFAPRSDAAGAFFLLGMSCS